jgi:hypothetical protein
LARQPIVAKKHHHRRAHLEPRQVHPARPIG